MSFVVKQQQFEGPLDLLLSLIEKRKLFINDISLAQVADDYIAHIRSREAFPLDDTAHFILIASTLVLIKSKSLLPNLELSEEEKSDIEDLELRLKIYQRVKEASIGIKERFGKHILFGLQPRKTERVFAPDQSMTLSALADGMRRVLENLPQKEVLPRTIVKKVVSLEEVIENLTRRITSAFKMSFRDFAQVGKEEKVHVIVSFLAMLELVKQGIIHVTQEREFDDITIETNTVQTPYYG